MIEAPIIKETKKFQFINDKRSTKLTQRTKTWFQQLLGYRTRFLLVN